ncbi:hypothetical protein [Streptomyces sp. NPDC048172]|uniref:hypothetical protein n=1 Tax=Streptomyces sp. NPDC048172 TaxID=3365505 RepID=UPI003724A87C
MKSGFVAYHYPHAFYRDEFAPRVEAVARVFRTVPGCLSADCWLSHDGESVVSIVTTESPEALQKAFATVRSEETRKTLEAEFGPTPEGEDDGTDTEHFVRPHEIHWLAGL